MVGCKIVFIHNEHIISLLYHAECRSSQNLNAHSAYATNFLVSFHPKLYRPLNFGQPSS
jgi:hypothetical protein